MIVVCGLFIYPPFAMLWIYVESLLYLIFFLDETFAPQKSISSIH